MFCKDYSQKKYHVGKQINVSDDSAYELYSNETLAQDDKTFFMKVQDIVRSAVDENKFLMTVNKLRDSTQIELNREPMKTVEMLADKFILTESERNNIFSSLVRNDDHTRYGLLNAVTEASKLAKNYDRATELERIGGQIFIRNSDDNTMDGGFLKGFGVPAKSFMRKNNLCVVLVKNFFQSGATCSP